MIDPTVRENLEVVDARNRKEKIVYLQRLFEEPCKGIVYCNSRRDATDVAISTSFGPSKLMQFTVVTDEAGRNDDVICGVAVERRRLVAVEAPAARGSRGGGVDVGEIEARRAL